MTDATYVPLHHHHHFSLCPPTVWWEKIVVFGWVRSTFQLCNIMSCCICKVGVFHKALLVTFVKCFKRRLEVFLRVCCWCMACSAVQRGSKHPLDYTVVSIVWQRHHVATTRIVHTL